MIWALIPAEHGEAQEHGGAEWQSVGRRGAELRSNEERAAGEALWCRHSRGAQQGGEGFPAVAEHGREMKPPELLPGLGWEAFSGITHTSIHTHKFLRRYLNVTENRA